MKNKQRKSSIKKFGLITIVLVLAFSLCSCTIFNDLAELLISKATDTLYNFISSYFETEDPDNAVYGSDNELAVGFEDGKMVAFWDDYGSYTYKLEISENDVVNNGETTACSLDMEALGYSYDDSLQLSLYGTADTQVTVKLAEFSYEGITSSQYTIYTSDMSGGWTDLDHYIATRYELFEIFNYIVLFEPDMYQTVEEGVTYFCSDVALFLGYDYQGIYPQGTTIGDAYNTEIASAISAFDDSAGYNYSYSIEDNYVECNISLRFSYDRDPVYATDTNKLYTRDSSSSESDTPHYNLSSPRSRNFYIDTVQNTVAVETSDQLYFALKRGYRPICVSGSNAEYIYNNMRVILSRINSDITPDSVKVHYIYDYIVDTVLYDYEFTDTVLNDESITDSDFFLYKCLYMEGVFGFTNDKTFDTSACVAICDGISKAILCMCTIEGIPALKISGTSDGVSHAWNKVQLDGTWYMVDATWGNVRINKSEIMNHDYLLVADDSSHIEDNWVAYPDALQSYNSLHY